MKEKILQILSGLRPECDFEQSDNYIEDGFLDSMDIVNLVSELEEEYDIDIPATDISIKNFTSIDTIIELVKRHS